MSGYLIQAEVQKLTHSSDCACDTGSVVMLQIIRVSSIDPVQIFKPDMRPRVCTLLSPHYLDGNEPYGKYMLSLQINYNDWKGLDVRVVTKQYIASDLLVQ